MQDRHTRIPNLRLHAYRGSVFSLGGRDELHQRACRRQTSRTNGTRPLLLGVLWHTGRDDCGNGRRLRQRDTSPRLQQFGRCDARRGGARCSKTFDLWPGESDCKPLGGTFAAQFSFEGAAPDPKTGCFRDARVVDQEAARFPDAGGWAGYEPNDVQVWVDVTIDPQGKLTRATISRSSGNMAIDQAALKAALQSKYSPKWIGVPVRRQANENAEGAQATPDMVCRTTTGTYSFRVTFTRN